MQDESPQRPDDELIRDLRSEALQVKDCFTKFSFQALAFAALVLGACSKLQVQTPELSMLAFLGILLLFAVASIGTYKYGTANRLAGYELHLQRTARLNDSEGWQRAMRQIGWEEAMRSWRVVMATIYDHLYVPTVRGWDEGQGTDRRKSRKVWWRFRPERIRKDLYTPDETWFEPKSLIRSSDASYHAGGYLKTMLYVIYVTIWGSFVPPVVAIGQMLDADRGIHWSRPAALALVVLAAATLSFLRIRHLEARRRLLEKGLFSIHSCAILWQVVAVAHYRALQKLGASRPGLAVDSWRGYTHELAAQAVEIRESLFAIHTWIDREPIGTRDPGSAG